MSTELIIPELTIESTMDWAQDPLALCGGSPVILAASFESLALELIGFPDQVSKTAEEIVIIFKEQSKRFTGCGANFGAEDKTAMIRRNPETSWNYILELIK